MANFEIFDFLLLFISVIFPENIETRQNFQSKHIL